MAKVFELDREALNVSRAVVVAVVLVPVVIVLEVLDLPHYVVTVVFGALYVAMRPRPTSPGSTGVPERTPAPSPTAS